MGNAGSVLPGRSVPLDRSVTPGRSVPADSCPPRWQWPPGGSVPLEARELKCLVLAASASSWGRPRLVHRARARLCSHTAGLEAPPRAPSHTSLKTWGGGGGAAVLTLTTHSFRRCLRQALPWEGAGGPACGALGTAAACWHQLPPLGGGPGRQELVSVHFGSPRAHPSRRRGDESPS